jgi:hypothetical protein
VRGQRVVWHVYGWSVTSPDPHESIELRDGQVRHLDPLAWHCRWHLRALPSAIECPAMICARHLTILNCSQREWARTVSAFVVDARRGPAAVSEEDPRLIKELERHEDVGRELGRKSNGIPALFWQRVSRGGGGKQDGSGIEFCVCTHFQPVQAHMLVLGVTKYQAYVRGVAQDPLLAHHPSLAAHRRGQLERDRYLKSQHRRHQQDACKPSQVHAGTQTDSHKVADGSECTRSCVARAPGSWSLPGPATS